MDKKKRVSFFLMFIMVTLWGLDYSVARRALDFFEPMTLLFYKFLLGLAAVGILKMILDRKFTVKKKDIVYFVATSITGKILAILIERVVHGKRSSRKLMAAMAVLPAVPVTVR